MSAMQLLALVNGNPSLPQSFRDNAVIIANKAIAVAQDEIANVNKTAEQPVILPVVQPVAPLPVNQPTYGSIQPMPEVIKSIDLSVKEWTDDAHKGVFNVRVKYKEDNKPKNDVPITLSIDSGYFTNFSSNALVSGNSDNGKSVGDLVIKTRDMNGDGTVDVELTTTATTTYVKASTNGVEKTFNFK